MKPAVRLACLMGLAVKYIWTHDAFRVGEDGPTHQPVEQEYELTRRALQVIAGYHLPVHMLTKSTLIERDIDILKRINEETRAIASFSFSSVDDDISRIVEPGVPSPSRRLKTIERFKNEGIACGMFLLPVIPFITDTAELIEDAVSKAKDAGIDFIIFGCMTLKEGRQKDYFMNVTNKVYPEIPRQYETIYTGSKWGEPNKVYSTPINMRFGSIAKKYQMPVRIPTTLFKGLLSENDLAVVLLEHIDYLLKLQGKASRFGYAAHSLSQLKEPLSNIKADLRRVKGVGEAAEAIVLEMLRTGNPIAYFFFEHPSTTAPYMDLYDVGVPAFFFIIGLLMAVSFKKRVEKKGTWNAVFEDRDAPRYFSASHCRQQVEYSSDRQHNRVPGKRSRR
jgi:DNA repair photolyase